MATPREAPRGLPFELRLALRYLTTTRREGPVAAVTFLCAGGVFTGVLALVLALALMAGLHGDIRGRLLSANPHVLVRPASGLAYSEAEARAVQDVADRLPGVTASAPFTSSYGLLRSDAVKAPVPVQIRGVEPEAEDRVTGLAGLTSVVGWQRLSEPWDPASNAAQRPPRRDLEVGDDDAPMTFEELKPPPAPPILLGEGLAAALGVSAGDLVVLVRADPEAASGAAILSRAFRVAGLIKTGIHEYDENWAVTRLAALSPPGLPVRIHGVELAVGDPLEATTVGDTLAAALGRDHAVADWTTTFSRLFSAQRWETLIMGIALGLIGMVAGFNIFTILTLNVTARIADIGILGALGASAGTITRIFLWMGLVLGGAGTVLGLAAGAGGALLLDHYRLVALDPSVYLVTHVPFRVQPLDLAFVAGGMLLVSFLATVIPARAAARLDPVVALRSS